jgi:uncharacterized RDD family membrane protein YckC
MNEQSHPKNPDSIVYAGLFRRLFAIFYDCILLIAILMVVFGIATALNQGTAIESSDPANSMMVLIFFGMVYLYFTWFWVHGGQTLGMKTWKLKLLSADSSVIDWKTATIRFISALFSWALCGLGFLWSLFNRKKQCWHDLTSKTVLIDQRDIKMKSTN